MVNWNAKLLINGETSTNYRKLLYKWLQSGWVSVKTEMPRGQMEPLLKEAKKFNTSGVVKCNFVYKEALYCRIVASNVPRLILQSHRQFVQPYSCTAFCDFFSPSEVQNFHTNCTHKSSIRLLIVFRFKKNSRKFSFLKCLNWRFACCGLLNERDEKYPKKWSFSSSIHPQSFHVSNQSSTQWRVKSKFFFSW